MTIERSKIQTNDFFQLPIFPDKSYAYVVKGKGFKRQQIRLMMGALYEVGIAKLSLDDINEFLKQPSSEGFSFIAPASGLFMNKINFIELDKHVID